MRLKVYLLSILSVFLFNALHAQDKIYKKDGSIINAKVKDIGMKTIAYTRIERPDSTYTIDKKDVQKIAYQNGSEDIFSKGGTATENNNPDERKAVYKSNIIAIAPLQLTENGIGLGLSYEKAIDANGHVSFYLPLVTTFRTGGTTIYGHDYYNNTALVPTHIDRGLKDYLFYAMPGIKFYPSGSYGMVKYAVGPSLVIAEGTQYFFDNDYGARAGLGPDGTVSHFMLGIMIQNSLNINPTPHLYLGLELGLGATAINTLGGASGNTRGLVQSALKVGYRF